MSVRILLLGVFVSLSPLLTAQEQEYLWPTSASPYLSSTFGETRAAHFHAGIDIKTWGREGYRVFATKDGIVYRLAISARGYGRVIYLKHYDGTYSVYAHLQRFNPELQNYIDSLRMIDHQFEIDVHVEDERIQVSQGDVIGYTGSTGIGPPHLHFEIRNENDEPINPLLTNLAVPDSIPPRISSLLAFPLSDTTVIEGSKYPRLYYRDGNSFGTVRASGPLGFAVSVSDGADDVTNRYAVYELGMKTNSDTLFHQTLEHFRFEEAETMFLDRLPAFNAYQRSYQKLYNRDGPEIPFYETSENSTSIVPTNSLTTYSIYANDIYGNSITMNVDVLKSTEKNIDSEIRAPNNWYWTENWVSGTPFGSLDLRKMNFGVVWDSTAQQQLLFPETNLFFDRVQPEEHSTIHSPSENLRVNFTPHTFFDTLTVATYEGEVDGNPYFAIHPSTHIPRKDFKIEFYLADKASPDKKYQLFKIDRTRDRLIHMDSYMVGKTLYGWPDELGEFIALPDNDAPEVSKPVLKQTPYGIWVVEVAVEDSLSGINFRNSAIQVNGESGITEYDFEEELLIYTFPGFTPKKENFVEVTVEDKAGNLITKTYQM